MSVLVQIKSAPIAALNAIRQWPVRLGAWARNVSRPEAVPSLPEVTVKDRQAELAQFYSKYEDLVELLCDAAQYGPNAPSNERYDQLRGYFLKAYPEMRKYVSAYLDLRVEDAEHALDLYGQPADAFEALFAMPTLDAQLRADDGNMITRIIRTREALNRYAEQLRRLAA